MVVSYFKCTSRDELRIDFDASLIRRGLKFLKLNSVNKIPPGIHQTLTWTEVYNGIGEYLLTFS